MGLKQVMGIETAPASLHEWDTKIEAIHTERNTMQARLAELSQKIADNWEGDTTALENEYGRLLARISATENVVANLQRQRREWYKKDLLSYIDACASRASAARQLQREIAPKIEKLEKEIRELYSESNRHATMYRQEFVDNLMYVVDKVDSAGYGRDILAEIDNERGAILARHGLNE